VTPEGGGDEFAGKGGVLHRLHDTGPFFFVVVEEHSAAGFEFRIVVGDVGFHVVVFVPRIDEDQVYGLVGKEGGGGGGVHHMELDFGVESGNSKIGCVINAPYLTRKKLVNQFLS